MPSNRPRKCPRCGKWLVERNGKYGKFLGCSGYPKCRYTFDLPSESTNKISCPLCGVIIFKRTTKDGQYLICKRYPKCRFKQPLKEDVKVKIRCPSCNKKMFLTWETSCWILKCLSKKCGLIYNIDMGCLRKNSIKENIKETDLSKENHVKKSVLINEQNILRAVSFDWRNLNYIIQNLNIINELDITYLKNKLAEFERKKYITKIRIEDQEYWKKG